MDNQKPINVIVLDPWGRKHSIQSGNIQVIDVSSVDFDPGRPFSLLAGSGGNLKVVDVVNSDQKLIPVQDGYNPVVLSKVIKDVSNTASNLWALF